MTKSIDRRAFLRLALGSIGLGAINVGFLSACGSQSNSNQSSTNEAVGPVALGEARGAGQSAQIPLAKYGGSFEQSSVEVNISLFDSAAAAGPALVSGDLDMIASGDAPGIPILVSGAPVKALCPISDFSADQAIVVREDITTPEQLTDKTLALFEGSVSSLLISSYMQQHDLDFRSINLTTMNPPQQLPALSRGDIDGYISWEPWVTNGIQNVPGAHILARANEPQKILSTYDLLLVRQDFLDSNRVAVKRFVQALVDETVRLQSGDALNEAARYIRAEQGTDIASSELVQMMKNRQYTMTVDQSFVDAEEVIMDFLLEEGNIEEKVPVTDWLDTSLLSEVSPQHVKV